MARRTFTTTTTTVVCDQCAKPNLRSWLGVFVEEVGPERGTKLGLDFCSGECRERWRKEHTE